VILIQRWRQGSRKESFNLHKAIGLLLSYWPEKKITGGVLHTNAPATFHCLILDVKGKWLWVHIENLLIYSPTWEEHLKHMEEAFMCLHKEGITLKISKCELVKAQLVLLQSPLELSRWPIVQNKRNMQLGMCSKWV